VTGWLYGNRHQFFIQLFAGLTIIVYDAIVTAIILLVLKAVFRGLRMPDDELEIGDLAIHDEEAYPADEGYTRVGDLVGASARPPGGSAFEQAGLSKPPTTPDLAGDAR
jgi:Amt family ammonium transporter